MATRSKIEPGCAAALSFILNNFSPLGFSVGFYRVCLTCCQCVPTPFSYRLCRKRSWRILLVQVLSHR